MEKQERRSLNKREGREARKAKEKSDKGQAQATSVEKSLTDVFLDCTNRDVFRHLLSGYIIFKNCLHIFFFIS